MLGHKLHTADSLSSPNLFSCLHKKINSYGTAKAVRYTAKFWSKET